MELVNGQKVLLKGIDLEIEICGMNPTGQPFQMSVSDQKVYRVKLNGFNTPMKEDSLNALIACAQKAEIQAKPEVVPNVSPLEDVPTLLKKKLGRPPLTKSV
jgi:hypothetical protein